MYDLKLTWSSSRLSRPIRAGDVVNTEGCAVIALLQNGVEAIGVPNSSDISAGTAAVVGFTTTADSMPMVTSDVELFTVPVAPATLVVEASNTNLVQGRILVKRTDTGAVLTPDYTYAGTPSSGTVKINVTQGQFKFDSESAGAPIQVTYLFNLTFQQAVQMFGQRNINNQNLHALFGIDEVLTGIGEIYTDQFDASIDWANSYGTAVTVGVGGVLTQGSNLPLSNATVVSVPSVDNPLLGIRFNLQA